MAAQLGSGLPLQELYARQVDPALQSRELMAVVDWSSWPPTSSVPGGASTLAERLRIPGRFALDAQTVPEPDRTR